MTAEPNTIADFLVKAARASEIAGLNEVTRDFIARFGFAAAACARVAVPGSPAQVEGQFGVGCEAWAAAYHRERCWRDDPSMPRIFANDGPFTWSSLRDRQLTPNQQRVFDIAARFGFCDGLIVPMLLRNAAIGAVVFVSRAPVDLDPTDRSILGIVAAAYASHGMSLMAPDAKQVRPLSARERECLAWSALGKSDTLTGQILTLSEKTVRMHVENARRKLDVHSRHHAIMEAWRRGWLVMGEEPDRPA